MGDEIRDILESAIGSGVFPGAVAGFIKERELQIIPCGTLFGNSSHLSVTENTLYDIASVTKTIPTSCLALYLIDQKELSLTDSVRKYVPQFVHEDVTLWHLLTHTITLMLGTESLQLAKLKDKDPDAILHNIFTAHLGLPPGTEYHYSNATSVLLGLVIEAVTSSTLPQVAEEIFFSPLQMEDTAFSPRMPFDTVAPTEIDPWRGGEVRGVVHDESTYRLREKLVVGSAGLFSTAADLLIFLQMILDRGEYKGKQYFSEEMINAMGTNQLGSIEKYTGLGWELNQPQYMGKYSHERLMGKTGFTGCVVIADVEDGTAMVLLSNYTYPYRKPEAKAINEVRRAIADIIFAPRN